MNAIKKITTIKNTISELGGEFISLINENEVLVKNGYDKAIWQMPFVENIEGYIFDGTKAKKVQAGKTPVDPVTTHTNKLRKSIVGLFQNENYDEAIASLKYTIKTLPFLEAEDGEKCTVPMGDGKMKCTGTVIAGKCSNPNCSSNEKNQPVIKKDEVNAVTTGTEKMEEMFKAYSNGTFLFDENGNINMFEAITPFTLSAKKDLKAETDNFLRHVNQYKTVKTATERIFESPEIGHQFLTTLEWNEEFDTAIAKALTLTKTKFNSINIIDARKKFKTIVESIYSEEVDMDKAAPWIYNLTTANPSTDQLKAPFLKFRTGAFTYESLKIISEELSKAFASKDLIPEDLDVLGNYRMIVEYMLQSKQINDHVLTAMIEGFNKRFVKTDDQYKENPLGWRSRDEQLQGWIKGFATAIDSNLTAANEA